MAYRGLPGLLNRSTRSWSTSCPDTRGSPGTQPVSWFHLAWQISPVWPGDWSLPSVPLIGLGSPGDLVQAAGLLGSEALGQSEVVGEQLAQNHGRDRGQPLVEVGLELDGTRVMSASRLSLPITTSDAPAWVHRCRTSTTSSIAWGPGR